MNLRECLKGLPEPVWDHRTEYTEFTWWVGTCCVACKHLHALDTVVVYVTGVGWRMPPSFFRDDASLACFLRGWIMGETIVCDGVN